MAGFDDLLDGQGGAQVAPLVGYQWKRLIGSTWRFGVTSLIDDNDAAVDLSSGFTASATFRLNDRRGAVATTATEAVGGLRIILSDPGQVWIEATPGATQSFAAYAGQSLVFDLIVQRTSDGARVPVLGDCRFIPVKEA